MTANRYSIFRFGDVEVREREFSLIKAGEALPVEPKAFRVLLILLRNPQKLITKEELLNAVWGDAAVTENSLTRSIALLRRLLRDDTHNPRFIETVATVGYRFVCKVEVAEDASAISEAAGETNANWKATDAATNPLAQIDNEEGEHTKGGKLKEGSRKKSRRWLLSSAAIVAVILGAAIWYLHRPLLPPRISGYTQITHDGRGKVLAGTDGSRLYFTQTSPVSIAEVGVTGGEIRQIPVSVPGSDPFLFDVSPNGSNFVISAKEEGHPNEAIWNVGVLGGPIRRLGIALDAAFSPDGTTVAYSTAEDDIWLVGSDGTGAHKVAAVGGAATHLAWSPDGGRIRFTRNNLLWEISANGSNFHQLLGGWRGSARQCCGRWTPDGKFFVFQSQSRGVFEGGAELWALDERHGHFRRPPSEPYPLATGPIRWGWPIPSKDGKAIFARGIIFRGELSRFDLQTHRFEPFLSGISAQGLSFSSDGRFVAYVSFPEGVLWKANRDGSSPVQLSDPPMEVMLPRWSPDGTQIVFTDVSRIDHFETYIVSSQSGARRKLLPEGSGLSTDPNWSPDGSKIVFSSWGDERQKSDIRILDLASRRVTILPDSVGIYSPRWSPDGRSIAALSTDSLSLRIYDVEAQRWRVLVSNLSVGFPEWSKDSQSIYFISTDGGQSICRIRVKGAVVERITDLKDWHSTGWYASWMGLDPTDAPLMLRDIGSDDIYALTLEEK